MSTLAAQGDRIFWGVLRPASSLLGVSIAMTSFSYFLAPFLALLIYNVPNLVIRYMGFHAGGTMVSTWLEDSSPGGSKVPSLSFGGWCFCVPVRLPAWP